MTTQRKSASLWYIAITHYLTAGFAVPFITNLIILFLLVPIFGSGTRVMLVIGFILSLTALWFGVRYSAAYLKKAYILSDPKTVVNRASTFYIILNAIFLVLSLTLAGDLFSRIYTVILGIAGMVVFYFASRKFVVQTS